jgi:hypothetical protein
VGCDGHAAYSSSKGGLNMLTRVMAAEWGPFNIQTNLRGADRRPHRHGEDGLE